MKQKANRVLISLTLLIGLMAGLSFTGANSVAAQSEQPAAEIRLQDDFYEAVNAGWLATAEIPADSPQLTSFYTLSKEIDETLRADFAEMLEGGAPEENAELAEFIRYYAQALDFDTREAEGVAPLLPYIEEIENLETLDDFNVVWAEWVIEGMPLPFYFEVTADMADATQHAIYVSMPENILPDKSYYGSEIGDQLLEIYAQMQVNLLAMLGKSEGEAAVIVEKGLAFDDRLVTYALTAEEKSIFTALYNPLPVADFAAGSKSIDFAAILDDLTGGNIPEQVVRTSTAYFDNIDAVVNAETLEEMKSWMILQMTSSMKNYLSEAYREAASIYEMTLLGTTEISPKEEVAYESAWTLFSEVVGAHYGRTYFGEEAKTDVTRMVEEMVAVYKTRLQNNTWLSEATKTEAIKKLDAMVINIGYPEKLPPVYSLLRVDAQASFVENAMNLTKTFLASRFALLGTEVDRSEWPLSADTVNAMYMPTSNSINFPAAILQAPFYSLEQTPSQNYGGIGAVIAHEISHAFDTNGAAYDEYGNMRNWWTESDYAEFDKRTQAMVVEFDGLPYAGGNVDGKLTVTENTADAGGLSCALEVVKGLPDGDLEAFFTNWAVIWRTKISPEMAQMLLAVDVHAPTKLRANIQLQNFEEFFAAFDIREGDGMWRAPEDRVAIW